MSNKSIAQLRQYFIIVLDVFSYSDDLYDRTDPECDCKNDCQLEHFFTTMEKQEFDQHTGHQYWFDEGDEAKPPSGMLANYLLDPEDVFTSRLIKNLTKLSHNLQRDVDLARKRFDEVSFHHIHNFILINDTISSLGYCNPEHFL